MRLDSQKSRHDRSRCVLCQTIHTLQLLDSDVKLSLRCIKRSKTIDYTKGYRPGGIDRTKTLCRRSWQGSSSDEDTAKSLAVIGGGVVVGILLVVGFALGKQNSVPTPVLTDAERLALHVERQLAQLTPADRELAESDSNADYTRSAEERGAEARKVAERREWKATHIRTTTNNKGEEVYESSAPGWFGSRKVTSVVTHKDGSVSVYNETR